MAVYGISYMGSKNSIAPDLCKYMLSRHPDKQYFIDCCCGGFAITDYILTHTTDMKVIANDYDSDLMGFYDYFFASQENRNKLYNYPYVDRETYNKLYPTAKNELKILLVMLYTFGNKNSKEPAYLYGKDIELQKELFDNLIVYGNEEHLSQYFKTNESRCIDDLNAIREFYATIPDDIKSAPLFNRYKKIMNLWNGRLIHIERLQRLSQLERLTRLERLTSNAIELLNNLPKDILNNAIVYFDPPYVNTQSYTINDKSFNNDILHWAIAHRDTCPVYISEYTLYPGMQQCYYCDKVALFNSLNDTRKHKRELLMYNGYANVNECLGDQLQLWTE